MSVRAEAAARLGTLLGRLDWKLRRDGTGFVLSRARERRELARLTAGAAGLTHAPDLDVRLRRGAVLRPGEKAGLEELRRQLGLLLESLGRGQRSRGAAAALESHEGVVHRDFLIRTTFACNQRCPFCFVPRSGRRIEPAGVLSELKALARSRGTRDTLTVSGGEPTLDPALPGLLRAARRLGFKSFMVQTNAVALARPGVLEKLVAAGARGFMVSLHSPIPRRYDRLTGSRGLYPKAVAGLRRLLAARGVDLTVNVVVNPLNCGDLPGLVDFLADLRDEAPGRRLTLHISMLNEIGHERTPRWAVDLARVAAPLREAVRRCRARRLPISRVGGESAFPLCLFEEPGRHAVRRTFGQDRVRYAEEFSGDSGGIGRAKRPACRSCRFDRRCLGVPAAYARRFGLAALRPPRGRRG